MTTPTFVTFEAALPRGVEAVLDIAPDLEGIEIEPQADLRADFDLDSMTSST